MNFENPYVLLLLLIPFGCVFQVWRPKPPGRRVIPMDLSGGNPALGVLVNLALTAILIGIGWAVIRVARPNFAFTYPKVLTALAIPLALLVWTWLRDSGRIAVPFDHGAGGAPVTRVFLDIAESIPAAILALVILILAGPQKFEAPQNKRGLTNIEICLDVSGSMTAPFGEGSRYDAAMRCVNEFVDYRKGDAFGLTFFGNEKLHWCPLTSDVSAIKCSPPFMRPENIPPWFGGTEIGKALRACKKVLEEREEGDKMIMLVTDGFSADLTGGNDQLVAQELKQAGIVCYAVMVGEDKPPDEVSLICEATGGQSFDSGDPDRLSAVFKRIDQMKQAKMEKSIPEASDDFRPYCIAALSLLGVGLLTALGLRYTPW
ncbi:MAG: VWA domain-containing protein [Gemmataceae bacterium]